MTLSEIKALLLDRDTTSVDVTEYYSKETWDSGDGPLTFDTQAELGLDDVTRDPRWWKHFEGNGYDLGVYEDEEEMLWICQLTGDHEYRLTFCTEQYLLSL
jgi:hypothetical protein